MAKGGKYILLNGEFHDANLPYLTVNRAFNFGDAVFESIRVINGKAFNIKYHVDRMLEGATTLGFEIPPHFTAEYFAKQIETLASKNSVLGGGKAKLTLYRSGQGTYFPEVNKATFLLSVDMMQHNLFTLNETGKSMVIYNDIKKERNVLSKYKTGNALIYVMAANFAEEKEVDDCFILNHMGKIIETVSSNIFLVSNGVLYTPPLEDGCVGGTMRMTIINLAIENGLTVYESSLSPQNLLAADEIILTNAVKGIQWVGSYQNKRYYNTTSKKLIELLNKKETNLKSDLRENSKSF